MTSAAVAGLISIPTEPRNLLTPQPTSRIFRAFGTRIFRELEVPAKADEGSQEVADYIILFLRTGLEMQRLDAKHKLEILLAYRECCVAFVHHGFVRQGEAFRVRFEQDMRRDRIFHAETELG